MAKHVLLVCGYRALFTLQKQVGNGSWSGCRCFCAPNEATVASMREIIQSKASLIGYERECDYAVRLFRDHGFDDSIIQDVMIRSPGIVRIADKMDTMLCVWRGIFKNEKNFLKAIGTHPELLYLKPSAIETRQEKLLTIFARRDLVKLLDMCPRVFVDEWDEVVAKIDYALCTMGLKQRDLITSQLLNYSLSSIRVRHLFVHQSGVHNTKVKTVGKLFDTSIEELVATTGLSEEEFHVFESMCLAGQEDEEDMSF